MRCEVCGATFGCPGGRYLRVRSPKPGEIIYLSPDENPGEGWVRTTVRKHDAVWVRRQGEDGMTLLLARSAQSGRIKAHYGVEGTRVGHCLYAFFVIEV